MMLASGVVPGSRRCAPPAFAVGLGTDGPAGSNNDLDLMEEIDLAAKLQKITKMDPRALERQRRGRDGHHRRRPRPSHGKRNRLAGAGKKADLILISLDAPNAVPMYDVYAQLAYALKASDIETVVIGGRIVMRDHKLLTVDEPAAIAKAREYQTKIAASLK